MRRLSSACYGGTASDGRAASYYVQEEGTAGGGPAPASSKEVTGGAKVRLELGAGEHPLPGYEHLDKRPLDHIEYVADARHLPFDDNTIDEMAAYNLLEHFPRAEVVPVLREWLRALKPGGFLFVYGPNLHGYARAYVEGRPGWDFRRFEMWVYGKQEHPDDFHLVGFSLETLTAALLEAGFARVEPISGPEDEVICLRAYKGGGPGA